MPWTSATVLPVFAFARHRVSPATLLHVFARAHLASLVPAAIHGCLVVLAFFFAAGHLLAIAARRGFGRFAFLPGTTGHGGMISRGFLALVFSVFTAGTRGFRGGFGGLGLCRRRRALLRNGRKPCCNS